MVNLSSRSGDRMEFLFEGRKCSSCLVVLLVVVGCVSELASCGKILILHPLYSGSHVLTLRSVAESLTQRGHTVHIVRWKDAHVFPANNNPNITTTTLAMNNSHGQHAFLSKEESAAFQVPFDILWNSGLSIAAVFESWRAFPLMGAHCEALLGNKELLDDLKKEKFDLAIIDILYNECGLALLHQLGTKSVVGYWAFPFSSGEADYTTAFLPSSHVPAFLSKLSHEMSFLERVWNTVMKVGSHLIMWIHCNWYVGPAVQKYFPGTPHPFDLLKDINGMLINTDYVLDYPRLLPPSFINVGGMQIRQPKELPQDIEEWMQSSGEHGVVLFTMGFIFNPKIVPKKLITAFLDAFTRLPQKFLMKYDGHIDHVPPNVKVLDWIPQQDVLAHNKTKLFLTHCGLHGVMESIYYAVPMVGMPIFIDQGDVLIKMKDKGIAVGFDKENATSDEIYDSLREVLYNSKYRNNIKKLSVLMRDVKETPLERATQFLEYLMRHNGAEHLKLSSRHLNFIQYFSIDTILFLFAAVPYLLFLVLTLFRRTDQKYLWLKVKGWFTFNFSNYSNIQNGHCHQTLMLTNNNRVRQDHKDASELIHNNNVPRFVDNLAPDIDSSRNGDGRSLHERKRQ